MTGEAPGVSFVVPVRNGARWIDAVAGAILAQIDGRDGELILVEDGSTDGSRELLERLSADPRVTMVEGGRTGAAAALNLGVRHSRHPLIAQVDQDVVIHPDWLDRLTAAMSAPEVGAAQGRYTADRGAPLLARLAGYELELRYAAIEGDATDHACTGNSVYRRQALAEAGAFDENLGYGYDNDMSYRLTAAGFRLSFVRDATSTHHWRRGLLSYLRQQYGLGYGRLEVVAKHPARVTGDRVSGLRMILHVPGMAAALGAGALAAGLAVVGGQWPLAAAAAAVLLALLAADRLLVAVAATRRFSDPAALALVPVHLLRDMAWVWACAVWSLRRLIRRRVRPEHSMRGR